MSEHTKLIHEEDYPGCDLYDCAHQSIPLVAWDDGFKLTPLNPVGGRCL